MYRSWRRLVGLLDRDRIVSFGWSAGLGGIDTIATGRSKTVSRVCYPDKTFASFEKRVVVAIYDRDQDLHAQDQYLRGTNSTLVLGSMIGRDATLLTANNL